MIRDVLVNEQSVGTDVEYMFHGVSEDTSITVDFEKVVITADKSQLTAVIKQAEALLASLKNGNRTKIVVWIKTGENIIKNPRKPSWRSALEEMKKYPESINYIRFAIFWEKFHFAKGFLNGFLVLRKL